MRIKTERVQFSKLKVGDLFTREMGYEDDDVIFKKTHTGWIISPYRLYNAQSIKDLIFQNISGEEVVNHILNVIEVDDEYDIRVE